MKKRILCILLTLVMLVTMLPVTALAENPLTSSSTGRPTNPFRDVGEDDWYHDAVMYVYVNNLFTGVSDTRFDPNGTMTRGMFVTVLGRLAGVDASGYRGQTEFRDVSARDYYAPYVAWAAKHGITTGTGEGKFSPNAEIDRQQMASFFARYFEVFGIDYAGPGSTTEEPVDLAQVADWAKDDVKYMWQSGLLVGDGVNFTPNAKATRAQAATLCERLDEAVETWYKEPGEPSDRIRLDPATGEPFAAPVVKLTRTVSFYDGDRLIDELTTCFGMPLGQLPAVEKSSKAGAVLVGYYYDPEFTEPFYADEPVYLSHDVFAKYQEIEQHEELMVRTFTQLDQSPDLSFRIERAVNPTAGEPDAAKQAASLKTVDGSDLKKLIASDNGDGTYTLSAEGGWGEGCSYELTLADGWVFSGKEATVRTASFTIFMEEVENLRMGDDIVYLEDTAYMSYEIDGVSHGVLTSSVMSGLDQKGETGTFRYADPGFAEGDILCIYTGTDPRERDNNSGAHALMPAVYVKVADISGDTISFSALDETAQQELYEIPDNFPLRVNTMPESDAGTFDSVDELIALLDEPMFMSVLGEEEGSCEAALPRVNSGDFVTIYTDLEAADLYFAQITVHEDGSVTYEQVEKQDILDSMDLYTNLDVTGSDLLSDAALSQMELEILSQVQESNFANEAAYMLADLAASTDNFRNDPGVQSLLLTDADGQPLEDHEMTLLSQLGGTKVNNVDLDVDISNCDTYFNGGVQIRIDVAANFAVEAEDGVIAIDLTAGFVEEIAIGPGVKGELVYKEILGIPIPIGVSVNAHVDIRNFTAFDFAAHIATYDNMNQVVSETSVASKLDGLMNQAAAEGLSANYYESLENLLDQYNYMLEQETDWIKLVEQEIFRVELFVYGLAIGVQTDFVVRTDMNIAIGSSLGYEVGKRYSFWFKIGLFEPTAGSDTMDLIDEQFNFHFYVMGKLGVKAGIKAKLYVALGSADVASVGIAAELGPYIKLWGFFIYDYSRVRYANTDTWNTESSMIGALNLEFGMYLILSFEAEALGMFQYSHNFLDREYPLLNSGDPLYYYDMFYHAKDDERVYLWDDDGDSRNGISMKLKDSLHALSYINLQTGVRGGQVVDWDQFSVILSNPDFVFDPASGTVYVNVSEGTRYMDCDMTITYLNGKAAFSNYDMTTTIPLTWTSLSVDELNEYYTVSVVVGDGHTHENVWSKRVLKGQAFDLPSDAEIKDLIGWSDLKYSGASGYRNTQTTGLTVIDDQEYYYDVDYRDYTIHVGGIHQADGTISPNTVPVTAKYGEVFDFSVLKDTGFDVAGEKYTKFTHVTTDTQILNTVKNGDLDYGPMDLSRPITGQMAEVLSSGTVQAVANYIDDSAAAVFTFNGLVHEDVTVLTRKGTTPSLEAVTEVLDREVRHDQQPVGICDLSPTLGNIDTATHYIVSCVGLSGKRAMVSFFADEPGSFYYQTAEPVEKLVGSLIVDIPTSNPAPDRRGYTFKGWFTEPGGVGESAYDQVVPENGITLYASWIPNTYKVNFDLNGSTSTNVPDDLIVTYDQPYGQGYRKLPAMTADADYTLGEPYGDLPVPTYAGNRFLGWSTRADRKDTSPDDRLMNPADGSRRVAEDTVANILDRDHTLYAQWTPLIDISKTNIFTFKNCVEVTYDGTNKGTKDVLGYTFHTDASYGYVTYEGTETRYYTEDMFTLEFMKQGGPARWRTTAVNAGVYDIRVTRVSTDELNGVFQTYEKIYSAALVINRKQPATLTYNSDYFPVKETYWANVLPDYSVSLGNYESDGALQFATTTTKSEPSASSSKWTSGVLYNVNENSSTKTYHLWMRVGGGQNYLPSNSVYLGTGTVTNSAGPVRYELILKTADVKYAGTDMEAFVTIGSQSRQQLHNTVQSPATEGHTSACAKGGNDLREEECEDYHYITVGSGLNDGTGLMNVTISVEDDGTTNPGWRMRWFRIDAYEGSTRIAVGEKANPSGDNEWFNADECKDMSKTFSNLGVYGRNLKYRDALHISDGENVIVYTDFNMYDEGGSWSDAEEGQKAQLQKRGSYDVYQHRYAPRFYGKFSKPGFDDLLTWSRDGDSWKCTFDKAAVRERMEQYDILAIEFSYGYANDSLTERTISITNY